MTRRIYSPEAHQQLAELFELHTGTKMELALPDVFRSGMIDLALALIEDLLPDMAQARARTWQRGDKLRLVIQVRRRARHGETIRGACRGLAAAGEYQQTAETLYRTYKRAVADRGLADEAEAVIDMFEGKFA